MVADDDKGGLLRELRIDRTLRDEPVGGRNRLRIVLLALILCLLAAAVAAYVLLRGQRASVDTVTAIAPAADRGAASVLQATGYVTARREATVSAQITGTLTQVLIEEGEQVQSGQVLARLDDTAQRAALAQAQAQLKAATALRAQYQAQLAQARRDLKRNQELVDADAVSRQTAEQAQTQVDTLVAQVTAQEKQQELAQAGIDGAAVQLGYTVIRAPFSGIIVAKAAQAGEIISPISAGGGFTRTGVGTIVDMDSLEIEVDVNEAYINRVQPRQGAQAVLDAYPDWTIPAHVIAIIPTADRSKATVKVRIGIDQKDPRILPDMGVRVSFLDAGGDGHGAAAAPGAKPAGVLVPASAIVERGGQSVVFVIAGGRAHAQGVKPGASFGDLRLVDGLATAAEVVRVPPPNLRDGSAVAVRKQ
ncbi:MAG TPA: efflux RND transporter periplasmic adaptor subunit [Steroidobacteraceae bacterium]|jgi:RND family efflux transporter MFP subunit|nr:efflux RND transporter periplasmic adaptor subunit [Steroidobacteraceae bacterium]